MSVSTFSRRACATFLLRANNEVVLPLVPESSRKAGSPIFVLRYGEPH